MIKKHLYTKEEKIKWFGEGEWVEEPDLVEFTHDGIECRVLRRCLKEPCTKEEYYFGGHLCGYISVPSDHPIYGKDILDLDFDVHWRLTYGEFENDKYWIGFDCMHSGDYCPSMELFKKQYRDEIKRFPIPEEFMKYSIFNPVYRNINFCIEECKSMAEQLNKIKDHDTTPTI